MLRNDHHNRVVQVRVVDGEDLLHQHLLDGFRDFRLGEL
jgi:hypothetical protein